MQNIKDIIDEETFTNPLNRHEQVLDLDDGNYVCFELLLRDSEIVLQNIRVPKDDVGKGHGTKGLKWLLTVSERTRSLIRGEILANGHKALDAESLKSWYERHGFVVNDTGRIEYYPKSLY